MLNLTVTTGKKEKRKSKKYLLFLYTIIPFLAFFSYMYIDSQLPPSTVMGIFIDRSIKPNYDTFKVSFSDDIPIPVQEMIKESVEDIQLDDIKRFEFTDNGEYTIEYTTDSEDAIYTKKYIPVGHIYWAKGETTLDDISKVYVSTSEYEMAKVLLTQVLDESVTIESTDDLISILKGNENVVGFVSAEELNPQLKVLSIDDENCLESKKGCVVNGYRVSGGENPVFVSHILRRNMEIMYEEGEEISINGDIAKINMSGVVAITRGLASKMDSLADFDYPARDLAEFLADADLTHVSNEVSFVQGCTSYSGMRFCSRPEYIDTLKASGVDIVELTGNHNNDYGASANANSIKMYTDLGWDYFGGGLNSSDASKVLYKEIKGNKIAFVGYNYYDTMLNTGAIAAESRAGANSYSVEKLTRDITRAKENADIVIVTFQFQECYCYPSSDVVFPICYKPLSSPDQKGVFRQAIDLGADVVVGTQAHQPQTYEVYNDGLIFYGLGNLYFDQSRWIGTRQGTILSIYIQDGEVLQAQLTPTIMGTDLIPKIAGETDSNLLLNLLKSARTF